MSVVLVVDDEEDVRMIARLSLELEGHEVLEAASGEEALALLDSRVPDVILLDITMPGIDGWEVLRRLRARPDRMRLPVVVFTANVSIESTEAFGEVGRPPVLPKPFTRASLARMMDELGAD